MKVYIPTMEELEQLQIYGANVYNYIITKVTEMIIMEDIIYEEGDMFEIINYLGEHPEIIYAIYKMYPGKIKESIIASKAPQLCSKLIERITREDKTIYGLDDILLNFDKSVLFDKSVIKNTISFIANHIASCPKYRFDYLGPNELLDSIFGCELPLDKISPKSTDGLIIIDPIYSAKLDLKSTGRKNSELSILLQRGMAIYTSRYGINESIGRQYQNKDIINKPDENVKRLIRCLEHHKKKCQ